jgi:mRNA-degrading endonuclease RelE of RelBE toxin-antitoxin system
MIYEIVLSPEAVEDLKLLDAHTKTKVKDLIGMRGRVLTRDNAVYSGLAS